MSTLRKFFTKETEHTNPKSPLGKKIWELARNYYQLEPLSLQSLDHLAQPTAN